MELYARHMLLMSIILKQQAMKGIRGVLSTFEKKTFKMKYKLKKSLILILDSNAMLQIGQ